MEADLGSALIAMLLTPRYDGKDREISPNQVSILGSYPNLTKDELMWFSLTSASTPDITVFREYRNQSNGNMLTTVFTES